MPCRSKLLNLFFHPYLRGSVLKMFGLEHFQTVMIMIVLGNGWGVGWWSELICHQLVKASGLPSPLRQRVPDRGRAR